MNVQGPVNKTVARSCAHGYDRGGVDWAPFSPNQTVAGVGDDRLVRFGVFDFDPSTLQLCKAQRPVRLRPQALKLLRIFVSHPHELVTRETIHRELWGADVHVDFEQGVNHAIKQLRAALGDDAVTPRYIETQPRLGYRFIASVNVVSRVEGAAVAASATSAAGWRRRVAGRRALLAAALVLASAGSLWLFLSRTREARGLLPANSTLAVIPFDVAEVNGEPEYLGLSLADAVIARLATGGAIRVRPVAGTRPYDQGSPDVRAVGRTLRVDYVLAGSLRRAGGRDRAQLQLLHAATARPVWSGTVDVAASDLIGLEAAISERIASAFQGAGSHGPGRTEDPLAFQAYLQGRAHLAQLTAEETRAAAAAFERALALDSRYALAHAGLAKASAQMYIRFASETDLDQWRTRAERHAGRALELEGTLAEAHEALAAVARHADFDWHRTIEQSVEALRLNASLDLPHYYLASAFQHIGRLDLVEREVAAGLDANPLNLGEALRLRGMAALWSGRFGEARSYFERLDQMSSKPVSQTLLAQALYYTGDTARAEALLRGLQSSAPSEQRSRALLASFLTARGAKRESLALVKDVLSHAYQDHHVAYSLGATYAGLGQSAEAFRWLRQAADTGLVCSAWYVNDPLLAPLRRDPAFASFITGVRARADRIGIDHLRERSQHR
jgi:DNA-binding winged helix-turn-helix (wHTH) protein/TolB-like protein/tetratricopeptide (TPR) repeat protein